MKKSPSALKRQRQNLTRRKRNVQVKSALKTHIKKVRLAVLNKDSNAAEEVLKKATTYIHKASSKGVIHWRNAARRASRLSKQVNFLRQAAS